MPHVVDVGGEVNSYRILSRLGAGGMGVVYKALDEKLNRTVALKFAPGALNSGNRSLDSVLREARAASALDHPNIGIVHGIEETSDGAVFIVLAYYDGETLAQKIRRGPLPAPHVVSIAVQIARGLAEAHARDIIHRDIKPSNVIVTTRQVAKIVDFGLARIVQTAGPAASAAVSGTAAYMSPEQALGRPLDGRTDLWSLGALLYEMLTGRRAFPGDSVPEVLYAVVHSSPEPMGDAVPVELQRIVRRALAKDPDDRYRNAREMLRDLERLQPEAEAGVTRTLRTAEIGRPARQPRRAWLVALPVLLLMLALVVPQIRERLLLPLLRPAEKHIAVLPFTVVGGGADAGPVGDGMMESLTARLSDLDTGNQPLWVVPASEVRRYQVSDALSAYKRLGATLVVTGSIQRDGETVRLIVTLIDARKTRQLGSGQFEDRGGNLLALQDLALARLAGLMDAPTARSTSADTGGSLQPAAYEPYLEGLGLLQRYDRPGNLDRAIRAFERAVGTDPKFALAFAGLGETYWMKYRTEEDPQWIEPAEAHCRRAIQLNDQLAPVFVTLGRVHDGSGKHELALEEFQRALKLDPRNPDALFGMASVYEKQRRTKEAEEIFRQAAALRPDYWDGYSKLGLFYFRQRKFKEAIPVLRKVLELTPDNSVGHVNLGAALLESGDLPAAKRSFERSIELAPSAAAFANLGGIAYRRSRWEEAVLNFEQALRLRDTDYRLWINFASANRWLKNDKVALDAYQRALPLLEKASTRRPKDAGVQSALGLLYARFNEREKALARIAAALALAPRDVSVMAHAGEAYEALGERAKAVAWIMKALEAGYSVDALKRNPEVQEVLKRLDLKPQQRK